MKYGEIDQALTKSQAKAYNDQYLNGMKLNAVDGAQASPAHKISTSQGSIAKVNIQPRGTRGYPQEAWNYKY